MSTTSPPVVSRSTITCLSPGAKVGKPKVSLAKGVGLAAPESQSKQKQKEKTTKKSKRVTQEDNVPMFKVLLLGDEGYQREHVLLACQEIIPECDNKRSVEIFEEAQKTGQSLCGVYPEEEAELYVQQFTRAEPMIFSELEVGTPSLDSQY
ncbi:unnamed protein product [Chrysoparadoxa australica]